MRGNIMRSTYLNILTRYTFALIFAMFLKVLIMDIAFTQGYHIEVESTNNNVMQSLTAIKYTEIPVEDTANAFNKPYFNNKEIDALIDGYIEQNSCTTLTYNILDLGGNRLSIFLDCGNPTNVIYNYKKKEKIEFSKILDDKEGFLAASKKLLALKYPKFVVDDVNFDEVTYNIKANELVGYYKTKEYGDVNIKINYNEIKDMLNFNMNYDDAYENETFTLDKNKKAIAFSFDDGPSDYDLKLIDLLTESHSTATFFVVGNRIENFPNSIHKMVEKGMEVGNHTFNHKSLTGLSSKNVKSQITKTNDIFRNLTGKELTLLRPSYGAVNKKVLLEVGMPVILWNIDTLDWKTRDADKIYDEIMNNAKDGDIVLMHSLYKSTVDAVERALKSLYKEGFQVVSISELAKLKGRELAIGKSYVAIK